MSDPFRIEVPEFHGERSAPPDFNGHVDFMKELHKPSFMAKTELPKAPENWTRDVDAFNEAIPVVDYANIPGHDANAYFANREAPGFLPMLTRGWIQSALGGDDAAKMKKNWQAAGLGGHRHDSSLLAMLNAYQGSIV